PLRRLPRSEAGPTPRLLRPRGARARRPRARPRADGDGPRLLFPAAGGESGQPRAREGSNPAAGLRLARLRRNGSRTTAMNASPLVQCLEEDAIPRTAGRRARVAHVRRSPSPSATSYDSEVVSVCLVDGTEMRFFLKDFGGSRRPRPGAARRRERELGIYRRLIGDAEIGTARYCGAVWDDG